MPFALLGFFFDHALMSRSLFSATHDALLYIIVSGYTMLHYVFFFFERALATVAFGSPFRLPMIAIVRRSASAPSSARSLLAGIFMARCSCSEITARLLAFGGRGVSPSGA
jgi:hypothetical protein